MAKSKASAAKSSNGPSASIQGDDGIPKCTIDRTGGRLRVCMRAEGLIAAGGLFEVVPVHGPVPPTPEERWKLTATGGKTDCHDMAEDPEDLEGDGINFQINVCALSAQFTSGVVEVTVTQDGAARPIDPSMQFDLDSLAVCQSGADKLKPTKLTGGFAIEFQ